MRCVFLVAKSLGTGVLAIVLSLTVLLVTSYVYDKYVLHLGPSEAVGWDPVSLFGQYWKLVLIGIPVLIFLLGCMAGVWFFGRSVANR